MLIFATLLELLQKAGKGRIFLLFFVLIVARFRRRSCFRVSVNSLFVWSRMFVSSLSRNGYVCDMCVFLRAGVPGRQLVSQEGRVCNVCVFQSWCPKKAVCNVCFSELVSRDGRVCKVCVSQSWCPEMAVCNVCVSQSWCPEMAGCV